MPLVLRAARHPDPIAESRRASVVLLLPVFAAAGIPWAVWIAAGGIGASGLFAASAAMAIAYLHAVWWLGEREVALRREYGRRYTPPPADLAFGVCMGLAVCMIAPGLSAAALVDMVGLPRAAGVVDRYDPQMLGATGATIDLSLAIPTHTALDVIPGGIAHVVVPRFGNPTTFALPWRATNAAFCFAPSQCLSVDPSSGRVSVHDEEVGRVVSVGSAADVAVPDIWGPPWEILNLFR